MKRTRFKNTAKADQSPAPTRGKGAATTPANNYNRHEPTTYQRKQVEAMAGYGIPHLDIARIIDVDRKTLEKHYRRELDVGHAKATAKVAETLYGQAVGGNTGAAIFWMKARAGWREKHDIHYSGGRPVLGPPDEETGEFLVDTASLDDETLDALMGALSAESIARENNPNKTGRGRIH